MMPAALEKASALTMFMPQAERTPATSAKSMGRSAVMSVISCSCRDGAEGELDGLGYEVERHAEVVANLFGQAGLQVALRQSFEEGLEFLAAVRREGDDAIQKAGIGFDVIALFIDAAVEEVGSGDIKLPEVFCFPGRERVGR